MQFNELPLTDTLQEGLQAMNFTKATPVQELAIPLLLEKRDLIACSQTGSGKTAAFLLPLLNNLQTDNHDKNRVNAIIMAPTRELAQQIDQMMEGFSYYTPFSSVAVYGGSDGEVWDRQKKGLLRGADVVIATPGRLLSHINIYNIDFSGVKYFILDEADRMLDMGFYDDIMMIEKLLPKERQTVMFSATMPPKIVQLAKSILTNPAEVTIAMARPPDTIIQSAYFCYEMQKIEIIKHLFKEKKPSKVLLFSGSKQKVKNIAKTLYRMGLSTGEMHSDLDQSQREHIIHEFKNERVDILVATDILARGIDIDDITFVINYDVPYDAEDYVHRIGRTARAGDSGMAITFVAPDEQYRFAQIERFLEKKIYRIPLPEGIEGGRATIEEKQKSGKQRGGRQMGGRKTDRKGKDSRGRKGRHKEVKQRVSNIKSGSNRGAGKTGTAGKRADSSLESRESSESRQRVKGPKKRVKSTKQRSNRTKRGEQPGAGS